MHWHHHPCPPTSRTGWTCFLASTCTQPRKQPSFMCLTCRLGDGTWIVLDDLCLGKKNLFSPALWVVFPKSTLSPLRSPTSLSFFLLRLRHQRKRAEQIIPPLKPLPKLSLGPLQRPPFSHPPSYGVHLALPPLLHQLSPLILPRPFLHKLFLFLLTVALLFSPCLARRRPPSWIQVPPLRSRLPRLPL